MNKYKEVMMNHKGALGMNFKVNDYCTKEKEFLMREVDK